MSRTTDPKIIFIVGNSRSGTTMLGRILGNHPDVNTFEELHFFEYWVDAESIRLRTPWHEARRAAMVERLLTRSRDGFFARAVPGRYRAEALRICAASAANDPISTYATFLQLETRRLGKSIPCEQTPRYLFYAAEILDAFPQARVINMVRDPRGVLLSQKYKWRRRRLGGHTIPRREALRSWVNYHPYVIARMWVAAASAAQALKDRDRFVSIRFEDLIANSSLVIRELCSHLGIAFDARMLDVPRIGSSTDGDQPELRGIDSTRAVAWRHGGLSAAELHICQRVTARQMEHWGYRAEKLHAPRSGVWLRMATLPFHLMLSLLLNFRRVGNLWQAIRRRFISGAGQP